METLPPEPVEEGTAQSQFQGQPGEPVPEVTPLLPVTLSNTIQTLAVVQPRSMGTPAMGQIVAAHLATQERREAAASHDIHETREKLDEANRTISTLQLQVGVLKTQLASEHQIHSLRLVMNLLGGVLIGIGVDLYKSGVSYEKLGIALAVGGALLIAASSLARVTKKESS